MREGVRGVLTLLRLRRRAEQRQALALGQVVSLRQEQRRRGQWLRDQTDEAWAQGVGEPQRDAQLLWLERQRETLARVQEQSARQWDEQRRLYRRAREQSLLLARVVDRRLREHRRLRKTQRERALLDDVLRSAQGEE